MKTFLFLCSSILLCSGYVHANESDFNSSLLFENENRIALSDGSVGSGGSGGSGGWYLAPHVGYNIISNTSTQGMNIKFENGLSLGLGLGFEMQTDLAFQFDFGYIRNDVDTITNETTSVGSAPNIEFTQIPLIANFIWSPSRQPDLKPYFLLGAGAAFEFLGLSVLAPFMYTDCRVSHAQEIVASDAPDSGLGVARAS